MYTLERSVPPPVEYAENYFFADYKKQYGKTYLEDFPNLLAMARRRLANIADLRPAGRLLDIGCAYGAFLQAATEAGFEAVGVDPAESAVRYVNDTLHIAAGVAFFPAVLFPPGSFDVVTLWYVIEHFQDPAGALRKIHDLLRPGGVLAFSTPSASGVSGCFARRSFLEHSPADHYTIWNPRTIKRTLRCAGFMVKRIVITGHHAERFPGLGKHAPAHPLLCKALLFASRLFRLGDTFEVYAQRAQKE
jgi:2-polyprenyl-3-methyl-5-hydroxy-6-metoxy-1,4-benzoquinol methylase